jgi:pimeloyl-ACP methyl ester carboxylesterase
MSHTSTFKTPEGEAAYLAAYDAEMKLWPVSYEDIEIPSRFGKTHVVVSGPKDAPPLVLLHGYWATLTMWRLNIADFSKDYHVDRRFKEDAIAQPHLRVIAHTIRRVCDYKERRERSVGRISGGS